MALNATGIGDGTTSHATDPLSREIGAADRDVIAMVEEAIAADNVMLAFQPVVATGRQDRPAFYEGLIRVLDRTGRIIPAKDFIGAVENREIGRQIDGLSLKHGLKLLGERPTLRLAINMSALSIDHSGWLEVMERGLAADPAVAERLILEITENSAITMPGRVRAFMARMQARGISFAIDDFGSGYTSMKYLKDLYFDILKIDGAFVQRVAQSPDNQALVKAIVSIAQHFDMITVAECVETAHDAAMLGRIGVDCLQGYYFGAPAIRPRWEPCRADREAG